MIFVSSDELRNDFITKFKKHYENRMKEVQFGGSCDKMFFCVISVCAFIEVMLCIMMPSFFLK